MPAVSLARVPTIAAIVVVAGLATATLTLAANSTLSSATPPAVAPPAAAPQALVVPDVRKQAYVFAKGSLEQEGFAWRVEGAVPGFAANVVVSQSPAPGAKVVLDGAPIVVLRLSRNGAYPQQGIPENVSPYPGRPARLFGSAAKPKQQAQTRPARTLAAKAKPATKPAQTRPSKAPVRKPAFAVPGAPVEPLDEIALSVRAKRLAAWVEAHPKPTAAAVNHWLYQHNWIVTGARFGWSGGAGALQTLVAIDARVQKLWGVGARSERVARQALAEVKEKSR
jgi:beta-lactam-binding protein with PASTA domain